MKCHYFQPAAASVSTRRLGKTATEALRETIESLWGAALQGWVAFVLPTIFPEMDSRLGVYYNGARFLSHALSLEGKKKKKKRGRASQSITCHCLSLDGWMMDDCIFSNNTKTLPMWETFCTGKNCVCVCVWAINISVFSTSTDSWHCALTCRIWHLAWGSIRST